MQRTVARTAVPVRGEDWRFARRAAWFTRGSLSRQRGGLRKRGWCALPCSDRSLSAATAIGDRKVATRFRETRLCAVAVAVPVVALIGTLWLSRADAPCREEAIEIRPVGPRLFLLRDLVRQNEVRLQFELHNTGSKPVRLAVESTGCACRRMEMPDGALAPGGVGSAAISLHVPSAGQVSGVRLALSVRDNDVAPATVVTHQEEVRFVPAIEVAPRCIAEEFGDEPHRRVVVEYLEYWRDAVPRTETPPVVERLPDSIRVETISAPALSEPFAGIRAAKWTIALRVANGRQVASGVVGRCRIGRPLISSEWRELPFRVECRRGLECSPVGHHFGELAVGSQAVRSFRIRARDAKPFDVVSAHGTSDQWSIELPQREPKTVQVVDIFFRPTRPGRHEARIGIGAEVGGSTPRRKGAEEKGEGKWGRRVLRWSSCWW